MAELDGSRKLVLVGFMGAGKSTAARLLSVRLGCESVDADTEIERRLGEPISDFFEREGESAFRERERDLVLELLGPGGVPVVALGGGAVLSDAVQAKLSDHMTVYMEVDADRAWQRARNSGRPLAEDREAFGRLLEERIPIYESVARAVVPDGRMDEVDRALGAALAMTSGDVPDSVRMVWAHVKSDGYPVYVGRGAARAAGALWRGGTRCFVVADEQADQIHGDDLMAAVEAGVEAPARVTVPSGEQHKTLGEAERVLRELAQGGMRREDGLLAFGGGVVGDLAGFCAGTYQRGVEVVQVPTTLVGQVDSAYGGKTGVDLPEAKNYVGLFHQPAAVITDPNLLRTLPPEELAAGFAEVVKTALIAGGELWRRVGTLGSVADAAASNGPNLTGVIERCLRTKLAVVAADERDHGVRAVLNLGHTFAHALEAASGYTTYRHGEAVAIGLLVALRLSERELGLDPAVRSRVLDLLSDNGLPVSFSGPSSAELLERADRDKKAAGGERNLVLLRGVGDVVTGCEVDDKELVEAIEEVRAA